MRDETPEGVGALPSCLSCARCSARLRAGRGESYAVSIVAVADPLPTVLTGDDLERDTAREIALLLERLRGVGEREAMEQVYRRVMFCLCVPCYRRWIEDPFGA